MGRDRGEHGWLKDDALNRLKRSEEQQEHRGSGVTAGPASPLAATSSCPTYFSVKKTR